MNCPKCIVKFLRKSGDTKFNCENPLNNKRETVQIKAILRKPYLALNLSSLGLEIKCLKSSYIELRR